MQNKQYVLVKNLHVLKHDAYAGYVCTKPSCHPNRMHSSHITLCTLRHTVRIMLAGPKMYINHILHLMFHILCVKVQLKWNREYRTHRLHWKSTSGSVFKPA